MLITTVKQKKELIYANFPYATPCLMKCLKENNRTRYIKPQRASLKLLQCPYTAYETYKTVNTDNQSTNHKNRDHKPYARQNSRMRDPSRDCPQTHSKNKRNHTYKSGSKTRRSTRKSSTRQRVDGRGRKV